jgi:hypothetical protein
VKERGREQEKRVEEEEGEQEDADDVEQEDGWRRVVNGGREE